MTALAVALQRYFTDYAHTQRDLSPHTIASYRDTWRLLIVYATDALETRADRLDFDDLGPDLITAFLEYLRLERHNRPTTTNARLAAIRAVLSHALPNYPEHAMTLTRVLAIPPRRVPTTTLEYLTEDEALALIAAPDTTTWTGRRDAAFLVLDIQTGLRVSELAALTIDDLHIGTGAHVTCLGKGRRHRATPLTGATVTVLTDYLTERRTRYGDALFPGSRGQHLSRDAFEHRFRTHITTAAETCPSLAGKHVTMHSLRHTAAMNLLHAGVDIAVIALWLGHQHTNSTDVYLHADMATKQKAIERTRPPNVPAGVFTPEPDILAWLRSL